MPLPSSKKVFKRTPEGIARHLAKTREFKRKKRLDPEFKRIEAEKASIRYHANKEKYRAYALDWQRKNKELVRERRKKWRKQNGHLARALDRKWRANSIKSTIAKFRAGDISLSELDRRLRETFVRLDARYADRSTERGVGHNDSSGSGKADREPSSGET